MVTLLRCGACVVLALAAFLQLGGTAIAVAPSPEPRSFEPDCSPCVTVVDRAAWDETQTVVDQAAWDETVTVIDTPATTGTRTIIDAPAYTVAHHDLVSAATTVARQVLVSAGYWQTLATLVPGHYEWGLVWTPSGYWSQVWVSSGYYQNVWVQSGYWTQVLVSSGYWTQSWVSSGYWTQLWQPPSYVPWRCWGGPDGDCDGDYWTAGYAYTGWVDTSHYEPSFIDTTHWEGRYVDTSHYEAQWTDTSHYEQRYIDTSSYQYGAAFVADAYVTAATWVPSGYASYGCHYSRIDDDSYCGNDWYSTAHWVYPNQAWVDPVYTTVYDPVPAVYSDWIEQVPAVTHTESYTIPAVTHQTSVHHPALTHTVTIHHDALSHQEQAPVTLSQSSQGAAAAANGTVDGSASTTPVTIPVVSTITLVDQPATTRTVTVVDQTAYDETRTVVDQAAYDEAVQQPIYGVECEDNGGCHRTIDDWVTTYVHHDAVTHQETVHHDAVTHQETQTIAAVTHQETLRFDETPTGSSSSSSSDGLTAFAFLAGLTGLAGAGRYASKADALRVAVAEMAHLGEPIPVALEPILTSSSDDTVQSVETSVATALTDTSNAVIDPGNTDQTQPVDTPPDGRSTAEARRQFDAWLFDNKNAQYASLPDAIAPGGNGPATGTDNGAVRFGLGFLKSVTDAAVDTVAGTLKTAWAAEQFWLKTQTDPFGAATDVANLVEHRNDIGRSFAYGAANAVDRIGTKLDSGDPGAVGEALGEIFVFSATAATVVEGGAGALRSAGGATVAVDGAAAAAADSALADAGTSADSALIRYMSENQLNAALEARAIPLGHDGVVFMTRDALVTDPMAAADTFGLPYAPEVAVSIPPEYAPNAIDNGIAKAVVAKDDQIIRLGGGSEVISPTPITIPEDYAAAGFEVTRLDPPSCPLPTVPDVVQPTLDVVPDLMPQVPDQPTLALME